MFPLTSGKKVATQKKSAERSTYLFDKYVPSPSSKILLRMFIFAHIHLLSCVVLGQFGRPWLITKPYLCYAPRIASSSCKEPKLHHVLKDFASFFASCTVASFFCSLSPHHSYLRNGLFLKPKRNYFTVN